MTIDQKIKELEEKLEEIKKENEELKKKKQTTNVRWRAEKENIYFYINDEGCISIARENNYVYDDFRYAIGNYFRTEELAEIIKQNRLTYRQLKDIALRLNKGQPMDWEYMEQNKYCIHYDWDIYSFKKTVCFTAKTLNTVYCLDENFLQVALEEIGEERLKQLLEWGI